MPEEIVYETINVSLSNLKLDFSSQELASIASDNHYTAEQLQAISEVFQYLSEKKRICVVNNLKK